MRLFAQEKESGGMKAKAGVVALMVLGSLAFASAAIADQTITAVGTSQEKVAPKDPKDNDSINEAVEAAHKASIPAAIQDAREEATSLASSSGLTLGAIQSVDENVTSFPYAYGPYGTIAPFGPGKYCGDITRSVLKRGKDGHRHRVHVKIHRCIVPQFVTTTLAVTFAAT
jgi:hypothetical protein